jgi:Periplasmic binding protein-like domain
VIGFDDIAVASLVGLSTVRQPLEESGADGARRLCALLRGERVRPLRRQLELAVVHRSSTAGPWPREPTGGIPKLAAAIPISHGLLAGYLHTPIGFTLEGT